jgi:hypothetical protein
MSRRTLKVVLATGLLSLLAVAGVAVAGGGGSSVREDLTGYEEVPAVSTQADGRFEARISRFAETIEYKLSYEDLTGTVLQSHIHFGQKDVNGGISAFLCSNLTTPAPPPGTQPCPQGEATITGTIEPEDVIGPASQGIAPTEFDELVDAIRAGVTYANVHSSTWPGGEIRAQLGQRGRGHDRDD